LNEDLNSPSGSGIGVRDIVDAANQLASEKGFFHWALEFPDVFENDGFDCILGNPPWERIKLQEKEFFASRDGEIAKAANKSEREKLIKALPTQKPELAREFEAAKHDAEAQSKFIRESNRFPLTAVGDVNTYAVFSETARDLIAGNGKAGIIVPIGIATDDTTKKFFENLIVSNSIAQLIGFENEEFIFSSIANVVKFCILSMCGNALQSIEPTFAFYIRNFSQINQKARFFQLNTRDIKLVNPNTLTCPVFRTCEDAELTKKVYSSVPVLENEQTSLNPWQVSFMRMFDMANDSSLFKDSPPSTDTVPLYEAKMFWHFDHRWGDYANEARSTGRGLATASLDNYQDPYYKVTPRYWIDQSEVRNKLSGRWNKKYLMGWRDITSAKLERTCVFGVFPVCGCADTILLMFPNENLSRNFGCLIGNYNSMVFDFIARQKVGGTHLKYFTMRQLPVLPPDRYSQNDINYITPRVLELTYTAWDIKPFADDLWNPTRSQSEVEGSKTETDSILTQASDKKQLKFALDIEITGKKQLELTTPPDPTHQTHLRQLILEQWQANRAAFPDTTQTPDDSLEGIPLPPFIWHETRRAQIRAELDAYYAKLYGLTRDELRYILDPADIYGTDFPSETFRVLKNNEMKKYGEYRTQRLVLEAWDALV
jgi:hypothetical protein